MSWARDEWKQELSATALKNVYELEQRCETLQKDNKQKQFQFESVQAALDKQKKLADEEKSNHLALKKEISSLTESCREIERSREKTLHDLNAKEAHARCLDGQLSRCQHNLEVETAKGMQLKNDLEHLQYDNNQITSKLEKQSSDFSKSREANSNLQRQLAGHKERVRALETQLKCLGEEPNSRSKKSSSSSDVETEWQSDTEIKLKETQASLQLEKERGQRVEDELKALKARQANGRLPSQEASPVTSNELPTTSESRSPHENHEVGEFKKLSEKKESLELQLKAQCKELVSLTETLQEKDTKLQRSIKELSDVTESLQKKEQEMSEVKQNLLESSKVNSKLSDELSTIKTRLDQTTADIDALERKAKQREQDMECQRHNSEAVIKGMEEKLKEKDKEHRQEAHSQSQTIMTLEKQYCDLERKTTDLHNKLDNSQRLVETKDQDIAKLKGSLSEVENTRKQQTCDLDGRIVEFEQKAKEEHQKCIVMKQTLEGLKADLTAKDNKIAELSGLLEQSSRAVKEKEKKLFEKQKQIGESQSAIKVELVAALEKCSLLQKEKDGAESEHQRVLQQKTAECAKVLEEFEQHEQEVVKLKDKNVHFENVLVSKEQEKQKLDETYKVLCEKLQKAETDLATSHEEQAKEKAVFVEKERSLQSAMEAMKNDSKALQHDYKKACELADLKSAETTDMIDKLEASQKHGHDLQQRMSRAEVALKEKEATLSGITLKSDELLKQERAKVEEVEKKVEELNRVCIDRKTEIDHLKGMVDSIQLQLNKSVNECAEKDKEVEKLGEKLSSTESRYEELQDSLKDVEEKWENSKGVATQKGAQAQELMTEIASKEKIIWELQQKQTEIQASLGEAEQKNNSFELQKEEDLGILKNKDEEITSLMKELSEIQGITEKRVFEMKEQCNASQTEMVFLQEKLVNLESLLQNKEAQVNAANLELQTHDGKVLELEKCLASKEEFASKLEEENAALNVKLEQSSVVLEDKKKELEDVCGKLSKLEAEGHTSLEGIQSELELLNTEHANVKEKLEQTNAVAESKAEQLTATLTQLASVEEERTELTAMLDELCSTNATLEDKISEKERMVEQVSEVVKSKEEELSHQRKTIEDLQTDNDKQAAELQEICSSMEDQVSSLQEKISQLEACSQSKDSEINTAAAKIQDLCGELSKLQDVVTTKEEVIECKDKEKGILVEELQYKTTALENKEQELKEMSGNFQEIKTERQSAHEGILSEVEDLKKEVSCLKEKLERSAVAIEMKGQDVESIGEQLQAVEEEKVELAAKSDELESKNVTLQEQVAELQRKEEQLSQLIKSKEEVLLVKCQEFEKLQVVGGTRVCELEEKCSTQDEKIITLQEKSNQLEACLQSKNVELNRFASTENELTEELQKLQDLIAIKEESFKSAEEELNSLEQQSAQQVALLETRDQELRQASEMLEEEKTRGRSAVEVEGLVMEAEKFRNEAAMLTDKLAQLSVVVEMKDQDIATMAKQLESVEEEKAALGPVLDELTNQCKASEGKNAEMANNMQQLSEILENKEKELVVKRNAMEEFQAESGEKMFELREQCCTQENQIASLQEKCTQLESLVQGKEAEQNSSAVKFQELNDELCKLQELLATTEELANRYNEEKDSLVGKLEQSSMAICIKEKELKEVCQLLEEERSKQQSLSETHCLQTVMLKEKLGTLTERLEKLSAVVEGKDQEITSLIVQLKSSEEEKAGLGVKLEELDSLTVSLQQKNADMEKKMVQVSEALSVNQDQLAVKCQLIEELQTGGSKEIYDLKEQDSALRNQILSLQGKCASLEACLERKEGEVINSGAAMETLNESMKTLQEVLQTHQQDAMVMEKKNEELTDKLQQATAVIESMKQEQGNASNLLRDLQSEKGLEMERQFELADNLKEEVSSLTERLEKLTSASELKDNNLTAMLQQIKLAEEEKANLENELDEQKTLHTDLQDRLTDAVSKNEQLSAIMKSKDGELDAIKQTMESLNKALKDNSEKMNTDVSEMEKQNLLLSTQLQQSQDFLQSKEKESGLIREEMDIVKNEFENLKTELTDKTSVLLETQETLSGAMSEKERLSSLLEVKEKDLVCAKEARECERKEKENITEELLASKESFSAQVETIQCLSEEKAGLVNIVEKLQGEVKVLSEAKSNIGNEVEAEVVDLKEQVAKNRAELKNREAKEQELLNKLSHKDKLLEEATKTAEQNAEEVQQLSAQKEMLQMDSEDKDSYIESMDKKVGQLESVLEDLKQKLVEKEDSNKTLGKELESVTQQLTESLSNEKEKESSFVELTHNFKTIEAQLLKETEKSGRFAEEIQQLQVKMEHAVVSYEEKLSEVEVLRQSQAANEDKISKLSNELDESEKKLNTLQSDKVEVEELLRNAGRKLEEETAMMEKEKESTALERSKLLREKTEECATALENLAKSAKEEARLKDLIVHLENISTSKDQEKEKLEFSYEEFSEKCRKREEELMRMCEELEGEKATLLDQTRELQVTTETLRHESKVMQQDCKKACELADLKSQDYRDVVDKLDASQKHLQEMRVKLSRAETELKETAEEVSKVKKEKVEIWQQMMQRKEEFEEIIFSRNNEIKSGQENILKLSSQITSTEATVRALETDKENVERMLEHAREELRKAEEELQTHASEIVEKETWCKNQEESNKVVSLLQEQMQALETSKSELSSELENAKKEISRLSDDSCSAEVGNAAAMALKESELEAQSTKIKELKNLNTETLEKLQKAIECGELKNKEAEEKIADLLAEKCALTSAVDEKRTRVEQLTERNEELEFANQEVKRAKECLEERVSEQEKEMAELLCKSRRLEEDLSAAEVQLEMTKKQVEESQGQHDENQEQKEREIEKLQSQLSARCAQVEKLQRGFVSQTEKREAIESQMKSFTEELESLRVEHGECLQDVEASSTLHERILELEHALSREKSNSETMMQAFQEQEEHWEEEKAKLLASLKNDSKGAGLNSSAVDEENAHLKKKLDEAEYYLRAKEKEHAEALRLIEKKASSSSNVETDLHSKIRTLESECQELKYGLKQKDEDIFVKAELLKQRDEEVQSLEAKYGAAEEVERELRHHLGEVTQQLEWSNNPETEKNCEEKTDHEDIKKELAILKAERKDRDAEIEEERVRIVEAAKGFAMEQEQKFDKKIRNIEHKLASKEEEHQEVESELKQLRHRLQTLQQEKNVLLAAAEEREQEFDVEKKQWSSGDFSYEKIQQYIEDLKEERQRVSVLQETSNELQDKLNSQEKGNTSLRKKLDSLESEQKLDNEERGTREDDLYSTVDQLRAESKQLKEDVGHEKSVIASLANEKAELSAKLESLEKQLRESIQAAVELKQECDMLREKLEGVKKDKCRLEQENDATVMRKSQDKLNLEDAARKLQEVEGRLKEEGEEKTQLEESVKEGEKKLAEMLRKHEELEEKLNCLSQEKEVMEEKVKELVQIKEKLNCLSKEKEAMEGKLKELDQIKEQLNCLNQEKEAMEGKVKELDQIKEKLKQTESRIDELSEDHQVELDSVKFTLYSAKDECTALQEENEELKRSATVRNDQQRWSKEKKGLLQQLEEATIRYNQAKKIQEDLEGELNELNIKVISLESKTVPVKDNESENLTAEIERLRAKVEEITKELEGERKRADEKEREANEMLESNFQLVKKQKKIVRDKESLESRFKIACEKLNSMKGAKSKESVVRHDNEPSNSSRVPANRSTETSLPPTISATVTQAVNSVPVHNPAVLLSPLARSLSNLEIKSVPKATSVTAERTGAETAGRGACEAPAQEPERSKLNARRKEESTSDAPQVGRGMGVGQRERSFVGQRAATRHGIPKPSTSTENTESKKRLNEQATSNNPIKRCRLTSGGDAADIPAEAQLPEGLPEVVSKGFADIPDPPIKSPFILRRTTAPVFAPGVRTRSQNKQGMKRSALPTASTSRTTSVPKENPMSTHSPPRGQMAPPEMALSPRKTNMINLPQGPRTKIPKPGSQVPRLSRPKPVTGSSSRQPTRRGRVPPGVGPGPANETNTQKECKMQ